MPLFIKSFLNMPQVEDQIRDQLAARGWVVLSLESNAAFFHCWLYSCLTRPPLVSDINLFIEMSLTSILVANAMRAKLTVKRQLPGPGPWLVCCHPPTKS